MRADLRHLDSADAEGGDIWAFQPDDPEQFALNVTATVGPADAPGEEQFQFLVCSTTWIATESLPKGFAFLRHHLIVERWDPDLVQRAIGDLCRRTEGDDWKEIAQKLSRFGLWEFEDYRE